MSKLLKFSTIAAAAVLVAATSTIAKADSLTVVSWGGGYTKSQVEAYHKPYTAKTGTTINSEDYSGGLAEVKAQVEAGNVTWDLIDVELSDAVRGCDEGLFESIDPSILPAAPDGTSAANDFIDGAISECAVGTIVWSTVAAYDTTKFPGNAPTTMADFFNTADFPGKRGLRKGPKPNLEMALMADGVPASEVYAMLDTAAGVDRAFAKLDTIKNDAVWWEAGAQPPQMLADGEVAMTIAYNGRIFGAQVSENKPFEIIWDAQIMDLDLWAIPKGAPNIKGALDFIVYSTDTKRLADQAKYISYGPVRKSSSGMIGKHAETGVDMLPHMPTTAEHLKNALLNNFEWWADHQDEMNERFAAWLAN
jgi:putative spermidine/putrescine transport system substrate-binding protein